MKDRIVPRRWDSVIRIPKRELKVGAPGIQEHGGGGRNPEKGVESVVRLTVHRAQITRNPEKGVESQGSSKERRPDAYSSGIPKRELKDIQIIYGKFDFCKLNPEKGVERNVTWTHDGFDVEWLNPEKGVERHLLRSTALQIRPRNPEKGVESSSLFLKDQMVLVRNPEKGVESEREEPSFLPTIKESRKGS